MMNSIEKYHFRGQKQSLYKIKSKKKNYFEKILRKKPEEKIFFSCFRLFIKVSHKKYNEVGQHIF